LLEIRHATALTAGAKHWHRQKAIFLCFCFSPPSIYPLNRFFRFSVLSKQRVPKMGVGHTFLALGGLREGCLDSRKWCGVNVCLFVDFVEQVG
ncbi:MAG: hypothetical protein SPI75_03460, partial [Sodaliphilus sp.]|nr:hypothetical protein [Sodaliphilus sp.]